MPRDLVDCTLLGVQVTAGLGFFCTQVIWFVKIVTPCFTGVHIMYKVLQLQLRINLLVVNRGVGQTHKCKDQDVAGLMATPKMFYIKS